MKTARTMIYVFVLGAMFLTTCSSASAITPSPTVAVATTMDNDCSQCINDFFASAAWCFNTFFDDPGTLNFCLELSLYNMNICLGFCELDMLGLNQPLPFAEDEKPFAVLSSRKLLFDSGSLASKWPPAACPAMTPRTMLVSS